MARPTCIMFCEIGHDGCSLDIWLDSSIYRRGCRNTLTSTLRALQPLELAWFLETHNHGLSSASCASPPSVFVRQPLGRLHEQLKYSAGYLLCEKGRNCVADLRVLLGSVPFEEVVIGKRLDSRRLANRQAAALGNTRVNKIMPVFCNMCRDRRCWITCNLYTEAIHERRPGHSLPDVTMLWKQEARKVSQLRSTIFHLRVRCGKEITVQILPHMATRLVTDIAAQPLISEHRNERPMRVIVTAHRKTGSPDEVSSGRLKRARVAQSSTHLVNYLTKLRSRPATELLDSLVKHVEPCLLRVSLSRQSASNRRQISNRVLKNSLRTKHERREFTPYILPNSTNNYSMPRLRNPVKLRPNDELLRLRCRTTVLRGKRYNPVAQTVAVRASQIRENLIKYEPASNFGRKQAGNVLHDKHWWSMIGQDAEILPVKEMPLISLKPGTINRAHSGPSNHGVCLAWWTADEHPLIAAL